MNTKAVIIGINDYAPLGPGGPDLHGCVNDANDVARTLYTLRIVPQIQTSRWMHIVTNQNATRQRILAELQWLIAGAQPGDRRIFYYSGHGTQVADFNHDELDARDEAIVPFDYPTAGMIADDVIANMIRPLPAGVNLEILLDSCFSGTGTRETQMEVPGATVRYLAPPLEHSFFLDIDKTLHYKGTLKSRSRVMVPVPGLNHVLWAACKDSQTSKEVNIGGAVRGVFTYWFCKVLRAANGMIPRSVMDAQLTPHLAPYQQQPQLEATPTAFVKPVFGMTRALSLEVEPETVQATAAGKP